MEQVLIISSIMLWIVFFINFLLTVALIRKVGDLPINFKSLEIGELAPNFTAMTLSNQEVNLKTYENKILALFFIAPNCKPCHEIIPDLHNLEPKAKSNGMELVLVSDANFDQTQHFASELNVKLPILISPRQSNAFLENYKVTGTPYYCIIDKQGKISATGFLGPEWQNELLEKAK